MNKVLYIILISLFSITVISCSSSDDAATTASDNTDTTSDNTTTTSDDDTTSDNITTTSDNTTTTTDTTAPVITEVTAVTTPTSDTTPDYTFSSTEAGTNSYGGSCSSENTSTTADNNTITFNALPDGTYSDCKISVTDNANNTSDNLSVSTFTIDTVVPTVGGLEINSASGVQNSLLNAGDNVSVAVTFSDNVSVTGIPQLTLVVGSTNRTATYASGNGSNPLLFQYTIQVGETDTDGISIGVNSLTLNSGTIRDVAGNNATITHSAVSANSSYKVDTTEPTLSETTLVPSLTNDNSTQYTFSSSKGGTISIGGSCSSDNSTAVADNMTVSFADLQDGTYSNCTITVTDSAGNSDTIAVNSFTIDTTAPTLSQVTAVSSPTNDNTSSYTFSTTEAGNITYGVCSGSPDNASVDNNTITFDTLGDGSYNDCKISVTDNASNTSDNLSVNSFTIDTVKPILSQVTAVTTPTNDTTPSYAFSSDEAGTISYSGCTQGETSAINGTNSISFGTLSEASYSCTITVTDSAENTSSTLSVNTFVIDTTPPTVSSISSSTSDGAYKLNDNITVTVTFNDSVIVDNSSGNPRIQLETGPNDRYANYISGNSTSILSFLYTVQSGDNSNDLEYKALNSLSANIGTIRDNATNDSTLTLFSPNQSGSLSSNKAIVIDGIEPTVSSISPTDNNSDVSITENISVTFSEAMDNTSVTTNTTDTTCSGSFKLSSDNFSSCVQMSSAPSSSNSNKTFTIDPSSNLSYSTTHKITLTTGVKDTVGNILNSEYQTITGFTTIIEPEPVWSFAHNINKLATNQSIVGKAISLDSNSNVYIAATSNATSIDGNDNFGSDDSFVVKYSSAGSKLWLRQIGSVGYEDSVGLVADNSNAIYLLGEYSGRNTNTFDNQTNSSYQRVYLIKFDNSGNQLWFKTLGSGSTALQASEIIFDNNSILFSGYTDNGLEDGIGGMNSQKGNKDVYLAKISKEGDFQWIKQYGESGKSFENSGLQPDGSGNYYLTSNYNNDISIIKISSVGAEIWKKEINNSGRQLVNDIVVDSEGDILITGFTNTSFNSNDMVGDEDLYVAKLNSDAQIIWSKQLGVTSSQPKNVIVAGISVDSNNNIYIAGSTTADFDGNSRVDSREETDNFIVKFDKNGNKQWSKQFGTSGYDDTYDIVITKWDSSLTLTQQSRFPNIHKN